jgi:hypothetical protein
MGNAVEEVKKITKYCIEIAILRQCSLIHGEAGERLHRQEVPHTSSWKRKRKEHPE